MQFIRGLLPLSRGPNGSSNNNGARRILASKPGKLTAIAVLVVVCCAILWQGFLNSGRLSQEAIPRIIGAFQDLKQEPLGSGNARLHLLIPATSSNSDLCKLLLSAQILGYPTPILINYGDHESADPYVQHLGKVEGILKYLEHLETSSEFEEDLVLILDGYDIWFQLRPDILIKRFYAVNKAANDEVVKQYGDELAQRHDMRQNVIFGPDKLCWPVDFRRPACWAVPNGPLADDAFGPQVKYEEREKNPAKWLNSGTVLGRASDLRDVFTATLNLIHNNHTTDSDQFYFSQLFGDQEYARLSRNPKLKQQMANRSYYDMEDPSPGAQVRFEPDLGDKKTEYHIGIDYTSTMFQTLAFWKQHLVWTRAVDSWIAPNRSRTVPNPREIRLPEDIQQSLSPFEPFRYGLDTIGRPGWSGVDLVYNTITREFPVLLHITGHPYEKTYRAWWWQKLWFQAEGEQLRLASLKLDQRQISPEPIAGLHWFNAEMSDVEDIAAGGKGGAFNDRGGWLSWSRLCKAAEEDIFQAHDDEFFHPKPRLE